MVEILISFWFIMFTAGILALELVLGFQKFEFLRNKLFVYLLHTVVRCLEKGTCFGLKVLSLYYMLILLLYKYFINLNENISEMDICMQ